MPSPTRGLTSPRVKINVTQNDIDTAIPRDSGHCMIADAVARARPNARFVSVDLQTIRFTDLEAGRRYVYLTPAKAQVALVNFDQGDRDALEPFSFTLASAHVLLTGQARKARKAHLVNDFHGDRPGGVPERRDGQPPPLAALPGSARTRTARKDVKNKGGGTGNRTGRRRAFGLRALIR